LNNVLTDKSSCSPNCDTLQNRVPSANLWILPDYAVRRSGIQSLWCRIRRLKRVRDLQFACSKLTQYRPYSHVFFWQDRIAWRIEYEVPKVLSEIYQANRERWQGGGMA